MPVHTELAQAHKFGWPGFFMLLIAFTTIVIFINPIREMPTGDDWAYALTVRHLVETGEYRLHDWSAANMPTQVYWGAMLSNVFGFSFSILRMSTLSLFLLGTIFL